MSVDPVTLTQRLVRFDTINPTSPELDCARFLAELLEDGGFRVRLHEFAPARASLVATMPGGNKAPLCFAGHIDTCRSGRCPGRATRSRGRPTPDGCTGAGRAT